MPTNIELEKVSKKEADRIVDRLEKIANLSMTIRGLTEKITYLDQGKGKGPKPPVTNFVGQVNELLSDIESHLSISYETLAKFV